jgi:hypothetical protein
MPSKDPSAGDRANGYVDRLLEKILGEERKPAPAEKPRPKRKRA